ncbi:MAG TPA: molecular chaperone SurA [Sedimenticola sp.]|nr:molecular chaperone SurA [Sedimenticola sp.]
MCLKKSAPARRRRALLAACLGILCTLAAAAAPAGEPTEIDGIVAVVNDDVVLRSELENEIAQLAAQLQQKGVRPPPHSVLERQVLERLILKKLQLEAAKRAGIVVDDTIVDLALKNIATENDMSLPEFQEVLSSEGISFRAFREGIRDQIIMSRLREQVVVRRIEVTEQELAAYLAKNSTRLGQRSDYHVFHILVATPDGASPEQIASAQKKARRLVEKLRAGADFKEVAMAESDGRQALEGGDLGWRNAAQLPTMFADMLANMERGQISDPIRNSSGFHIIMLDDYTGGERQVVTQTHARHILIRTNEITSDEDARNRLDQLRQRIEGGDDFGALARSHSDDKSSAIKGGDLGWTNPGDLVPKFEQAMSLLEPGQVSPPFKTQFGWHIVQVLERRQHDNTEEVQKAKARNAIRERKAAEETELYLRRLRDEAYVEIRLPDF